MWLKIWTSNSNPIFIGKWYIEALLESRTLPHYLRLDKGTETTTMSTIHAYLRHKQGDLSDPTESILFGPSPSNQVCIQSDYTVVLNNENKTDTFLKL